MKTLKITIQVLIGVLIIAITAIIASTKGFVIDEVVTKEASYLTLDDRATVIKNKLEYEIIMKRYEVEITEDIELSKFFGSVLVII